MWDSIELMFHNENPDHDCQRDPPQSKWFQLALAVLPAVLPVVVHQLGEAIAFFANKGKEAEQPAKSEKDEANGDSK